MGKIPSTRTAGRRQRMARALARRQDDLTLVLANIHDPHNVSAIYRSCDAFGVATVTLYYTDTAFPVLGRKTSASARKWVESRRISDADELFAKLKQEGMQILATSFTERSISFRSCDFTRPTAVILGNEHAGVGPELLDRADGQIHIPMYGMIQSLNVSVAAAVILSEAARQRELAGFYNSARIAEPEFTQRLEAWLAK